MDRTRKRDLPDWFSQEGEWHSRHWRWYPNHLNPVPTFSQYTGRGVRIAGKPTGQQITVDENHKPSLPLSASMGDIGGNFYSERSGVSVVYPETQHLYGETLSNDERLRCEYDGPFEATGPDFLLLPPTTLDNLVPKGTTAIARCKPTNNVAAASVALGEILHDGLPALLGATLWKNKASAARSAGGEYLNSEFGWKPLLNDIRSVSFAAANAHRILSQYERDAGRVVRRRYEFPVVRTESTSIISGYDGRIRAPTDGGLIDFSVPRPQLCKTTRTYKRTWFSGAFTYHLPTGYKSRNRLERMAAKAGPLLGLDLTPDTLWNLQPWTWAVDWFSNMGDVVSNLSDWATDGLVLRYGYIMEHQYSSDTYYLDGPSRYKPKGIHPSPVVAWKEIKRRQKATPFGFGATWDGLTPRQLAIAAALGLTRVF